MLITIAGQAGSGKDACADTLVKSGGWVKVGLADVLKRAAKEFFAFTDDQLWGPSKLRNEPDQRYPNKWYVDDDGMLTDKIAGYLTPRHALQQLGTEFGRNCYPNVWIDYALRVAHKLSAEGGYTYTQQAGLRHDWRPGEENWHTHVVIPDARFENELTLIRAAGGKLIRIKRPGAGLEGTAAQHVSETEQQRIPDEFFDHVLVNDFDLETLQSRVRMLVTLMQTMERP